MEGSHGRQEEPRRSHQIAQGRQHRLSFPGEGRRRRADRRDVVRRPARPQFTRRLLVALPDARHEHEHRDRRGGHRLQRCAAARAIAIRRSRGNARIRAHGCTGHDDADDFADVPGGSRRRRLRSRRSRGPGLTRKYSRDLRHSGRRGELRWNEHVCVVLRNVPLVYVQHVRSHVWGHLRPQLRWPEHLRRDLVLPDVPRPEHLWNVRDTVQSADVREHMPEHLREHLREHLPQYL